MITLGIDTSNYTTSVALFDGNGHKMLRKILDVKDGMRGIRQSDGVFIHNRELPEMISDAVGSAKIDAVGVSTKPRNVQGSYMPVFTVGSGYAKAIAAVLGVKCYEFSHQDGHIMAGLYSSSANKLLSEPFLSVHLSGGTTEILRSNFNGYRFENEIVGGTLDISAGQLIDRIGVGMGLKFPCGKKLEKLAVDSDRTLKLPYAVKNAYVNLSGIETKLLNMTDGENCVIARTVFEYLAHVLIKMLNSAKKSTGIRRILVVGGVASNTFIRSALCDEFSDNIFFASKEMSSDNAVGTAVLAYMAEERDKWKNNVL